MLALNLDRKAANLISYSVEMGATFERSRVYSYLVGFSYLFDYIYYLYWIQNYLKYQFKTIQDWHYNSGLHFTTNYLQMIRNLLHSFLQSIHFLLTLLLRLEYSQQQMFDIFLFLADLSAVICQFLMNRSLNVISYLSFYFFLPTMSHLTLLLNRLGQNIDLALYLSKVIGQTGTQERRLSRFQLSLLFFTLVTLVRRSYVKGFWFLLLLMFLPFVTMIFFQVGNHQLQKRAFVQIHILLLFLSFNLPYFLQLLHLILFLILSNLFLLLILFSFPHIPLNFGPLDHLR